MKRFTITEGAPTTAGGRVTSASSNGSILGARIALEGDPVFCPSCKSIGHIVCVAPRHPETWNGKLVALDNDRCACACPTSPRLRATQSIRFQLIDEAMCSEETATESIDVSASAAQGAPILTSAMASDTDTDVDIVSRSFALLNAHGGAAEGYVYDLYREGSRHIHQGRLTVGETASVDGEAELSLVVWLDRKGASHRA